MDFPTIYRSYNLTRNHSDSHIFTFMTHFLRFLFVSIMTCDTSGSHVHKFVLHFHTCQPPGERSRNLCIVRISFLTMSVYSLKITPRPSEFSDVSQLEQHLPTILTTVPIIMLTFYLVLCNFIGGLLTNYDTIALFYFF